MFEPICWDFRESWGMGVCVILTPTSLVFKSNEMGVVREEKDTLIGSLWEERGFDI